MISYIEGRVLKINPDSLIVLTEGGVGFQIFVPNSVFREAYAIGKTICLFTYMQVREDGLFLFGFTEEADLEMFKKIITVSGVGPKLALSILSSFGVTELCYSIMAGDVKTITQAPGVGKKMAEKIILELKDYATGFNESADDYGGAKVEIKTENSSGLYNEAAQALAALGISMTEAMKAVRSISVTEETTVEDLIKQALKKI